MKNRWIIYFTFILLLFVKIIQSDNKLPNLFGLSKGDEKKCILISTTNIDNELKILLGPSFDVDKGIPGELVLKNSLLNTILNKNLEKKVNTTFFNREVLNLDTLLGAPNNTEDGILGTLKNYSIIYIEGHSGFGGIDIEHYRTYEYSEEKKQLVENKKSKEYQEFDENLKRYRSIYGEDYIYPGILGEFINSQNIDYARAIGIRTELLEQELPRLNNTLVILGNCYGTSFAEAFFRKGASVIIAHNQTTYRTSPESILQSLCGLSFSRINYTVLEVYNRFCKNLSENAPGWYILSPSNTPESMDYVLYRQPRIESVTVAIGNKDDQEKEIIYEYQFPKDHNPHEKYPSENLMKLAKKKSYYGEKNFFVKIDFSDPIDINNEATGLKKAVENNEIDGYLFRLYACPLDKITGENAEYVKAEEIIFSNNNTTVTMNFNSSKFKNKSYSVAHLVVRALDMLTHDKMYYLDTIGRGRDDNMAECEASVDGECVYSDGGAESNDGLDMNHWFWVGPTPVLKIQRMAIKPLHFETFEYENEFGALLYSVGRTIPEAKLKEKELATGTGSMSSSDLIQYMITWQCRDYMMTAYPNCKIDTMTYYQKFLHPTYFLNNEFASKAIFEAVLESDISLENYSTEELKDLLELKIITQNPHEDRGIPEEKNFTKLEICELEIDKQNTKLLRVKIKALGTLETKNGFQTISLETNNGKAEEEKIVIDKKQLTYFKDVSGPKVNSFFTVPGTSVSMAVMVDQDSGWDHNWRQVILAYSKDIEKYRDVAMNSIKDPSESDTKIEDIIDIPEKSPEFAFKDFYLNQDDNAVNGISLDGTWAFTRNDYILQYHPDGIMYRWNEIPPEKYVPGETTAAYFCDPDWEDCDAAVFSLEGMNYDSIRLWLMSDIEDWKRFSMYEVGLIEDKVRGNINDKGIHISLAPEIIEAVKPKYIKVEAKNKWGNEDIFIKEIKFNAGAPEIQNLNANTNKISFNIKDYGTPPSKLKFQYNGSNYDYSKINNITSKVTSDRPTDERQLYQLRARITDLAGNTTDQMLFKDQIAPKASVQFNNENNTLLAVYEDNQTGIDSSRLAFSIDNQPVKLNITDQNLYKGTGEYSNPNLLTEGQHTAKLTVYDYAGNVTVSDIQVFDVSYGPEIISFSHLGASNQKDFYALIKDKSNDIDPNSISLKIDGQIEVPLDSSFNPLTGVFKWAGNGSLSIGTHDIELTVQDLKGKTDKANLQLVALGNASISLSDVILRDVEGNGDGAANEGERIYLNLDLKNIGNMDAIDVQGQLLSRSRYIKGVPEFKDNYGTISPNLTATNKKPYEFIVEDKIFSSEDIDEVTADFILRVSFKYKSEDKTKSNSVDLSFKVKIIRTDPIFAQFSIKLKRDVSETLDPKYILNGTWYEEGTFLKDLSIVHFTNSQESSLPPIIDRANKSFSCIATLGVGDNRFVVTATADNGVVRTAEVSVKLTSRVGISLDEIAETASPNVTVTGRAWTVNSKLESVEVYMNGADMGSVVFDGDGRFSLPVTLNGGENIIRAVARDDQGKIAADEITVRLHGLLTIRWARANFTATATPYEACGSYQVEGDDIASIVTYINGATNTHQVTIDRDLKTFCTTFDLQPGNNLLRAVGTSTGGVSSDAYSRVEYTTGGTLSINMNPLPVYTTSISQTISGTYTLGTEDPFTIEVVVQGLGWTSYTPTIDPIARTYTVDVTLFDRFPWCSNLLEDCGCSSLNEIYVIIYQGADSAYDYQEITVGWPIINNGVDSYDPDLCEPVFSPVGWIEGSFAIADPTVHITDIVIHTQSSSGDRYYTVTDWSEVTGRFRFEFTDYSAWGWQVLITATDGNTYGCRGNNCPGSVRPPSIEKNKKINPKRITKPSDKERNKKIKDRD